MTQTKAGLLSLIAACTIWGLSPLFYHALAPVAPVEILAHRTLWSLVFLGAVVLATGRGRLLSQALRAHFGLIAGAAVAISVNWLVFISSVQMDRATEASLGYFVFPLVAVALGRLFLGEQLGRLQAVAVGLAAAAVGLLSWGLGAAPWIALALGLSFGLYGLLKKRLPVPGVVSVLAEVVILAPLAVAALVALHGGFWAMARPVGIFGHDLWLSLLLVASGPITGVPLLLFSRATQAVSMATVGLVQYLNPTLQFLVATLVFVEPFTPWHALAFGMIWLALALYTLAAWRGNGARARPAVPSQPSAAASPSSSAATSGTRIR
ncbi:EamA family transporter RarD [Phaeovulum vinaykumarii]|uniref:Chloramphenicol-sensitive protein RarD n=1 Tax=Phaeovulum vinaykumarii TaxID=407234 RepID=A0A1N7JL50_9RHOB|nr:EamA family transporter RarD [Phaeovulum vinaykumarii]SIS50037.1 chloramphenicol-sensitive protein RarD [Phaeovulum vinaykumarii]SOB90063.1 chloramphenicol-sensitive protein RarD [Phaeovulum vinaykumarii]